MADHRCSLRAARANTLRLTGFTPKTRSPAKDSDMELYEKPSGETLQDPHQRMLLEDMCPERLRARLRDHGPERWPTLWNVRREISDWLADKLAKPHTSQALGAQCIAR